MKRFLEKSFVIPRIDEHWVTSKYVGSILKDYAGADSIVVSPVLDNAFFERRLHANTSTRPSAKKNVIITHGRLVS